MDPIPSIDDVEIPQTVRLEVPKFIRKADLSFHDTCVRLLKCVQQLTPRNPHKRQSLDAIFNLLKGGGLHWISQEQQNRLSVVLFGKVYIGDSHEFRKHVLDTLRKRHEIKKLIDQYIWRLSNSSGFQQIDWPNLLEERPQFHQDMIAALQKKIAKFNRDLVRVNVYLDKGQSGKDGLEQGIIDDNMCLTYRLDVSTESKHVIRCLESRLGLKPRTGTFEGLLTNYRADRYTRRSWGDYLEIVRNGTLAQQKSHVRFCEILAGAAIHNHLEIFDDMVASSHFINYTDYADSRRILKGLAGNTQYERFWIFVALLPRSMGFLLNNLDYEIIFQKANARADFESLNFIDIFSDRIGNLILHSRTLCDLYLKSLFNLSQIDSPNKDQMIALLRKWILMTMDPRLTGPAPTGFDFYQIRHYIEVLDLDISIPMVFYGPNHRAIIATAEKTDDAPLLKHFYWVYGFLNLLKVYKKALNMGNFKTAEWAVEAILERDRELVFPPNRYSRPGGIKLCLVPMVHKRYPGSPFEARITEMVDVQIDKIRGLTQSRMPPSQVYQY